MIQVVRGLLLFGVVGVACYQAPTTQAAIVFGMDVVVAGDHCFNGGQIWGRTVVAGGVTGNGGAVATKLVPQTPGPLGSDTFIVGGNLNARLNVHAGNVAVGGAYTPELSFPGKGTVGGLTHPDSLALANSVAMRSAFTDASHHFAGLTAESHYTLQGNTLTFSAVPGADGVAVFDVAMKDLNNRNANYLLDLNGASSVVFNVTGDVALTGLGNFHSSFKDHASQILWNFIPPSQQVQKKETLTHQIDREWYGSLLLPDANLINRSAINGGVYTGSNFEQHADVRQVGYGGPPLPIPDAARPLPPSPPEFASVPEPASVVIFLVGGLIFAGGQWRKSRKRAT